MESMFYVGERITLEDEEGNEDVIELLDRLEYKGETYFFFAKESEDPEEIITVVMQQREKDGEFSLEVPEDDELYDTVFDMFEERLSEEGLGQNAREEKEYGVTGACLGCGACADVCPVKAISKDGDQYEIDWDICLNCGACLDVCPADAINLL